MSGIYKADLIEAERPDPKEASSTRFMAVPLTLWSVLVIFGCGYLAVNTANAEWKEGDKRTPKTAGAASQSAAVDMTKLGADVYKKNCQACHQPTGLGVGAAFPPLKGSEWVVGDEEVVPAIVAHGLRGEIQVQGKTFKGVMPAFKGKLTPVEIAAVATHLRTTWGNQAGPVSPETVERVLRQTESRTSSWAGGAELKEQKWTK